PHRDGPFSPGELVRDLAPWAEPGTGAVYHPSAKVPPGAPGTGTWAASFRRLGPGYVPQWNSIGGAAASTAAGGAAVGAGQAGFSSATLGVDPLNVASGGGADAFTPPGGAGPSPASTADTTGWAPKEPPQDQDLPEFGSLVQADREDGAHALDTYQARHQRSMFDSRLEPPPSPDPRRGATAVPGPAERRASVPPTVDPPPGEPPTSGTVHTAPPSARATKPFGTPFAP